jgi:hypothetical protein
MAESLSGMSGTTPQEHGYWSDWTAARLFDSCDVDVRPHTTALRRVQCSVGFSAIRRRWIRSFRGCDLRGELLNAIGVDERWTQTTFRRSRSRITNTEYPVSTSEIRHCSMKASALLLLSTLIATKSILSIWKASRKTTLDGLWHTWTRAEGQ